MNYNKMLYESHKWSKIYRGEYWSMGGEWIKRTWDIRIKEMEALHQAYFEKIFPGYKIEYIK